MSMRQCAIFAVTSRSLSFEYSRRASTYPVASSPAKCTEVLRSRGRL